MVRGRSVGAVLVALAVLCGLGLVFAGGAYALSFSKQITGAETPLGEFVRPQGVAVDSSGDVFVADFFGKVIDKFGPLGTYESQINGAETPPEGPETGEELFEPRGIALNTAGDIFAAVPFRKAVEEFDSTGKFVGRITSILNASSEPEELGTPQAVAVDNSGSVSDPSDGDLYVADSGSQAIDKFTGAGVFVSQLPAGETPAGVFENPQGVAVGSHGEVYVADRSAHVIDRFSAEGKYESQITEANIPLAQRGEPFSPGGLAVDPTGSIYVSDSANHLVEEFSPAGVLLHRVNQAPAGAPVEGIFGEPRALALDTLGNLYIADATKQVIDVFAPTNPPEAVIGAATETEATSTGAGAILHGTVNPNGANVTVCEFQYGTTTSYGQTAPCTTTGNTPIGSGSTPVPVTARVEGLLPNTVYHYRLLTKSANGTGESPEAHFTSGTLTPAPGEIEATNITEFTTILAGTLNTRNAPAAYHFVYGTSTSYTNIAPSPDLILPASEVPQVLTPQTITGLQPGITYHYALVTTGPGGSTTSPDHTFTTPPIPPPLAATGPATGITETTVTLNGSIDPQEWATTYTFEYGTNTAYGQAWPTTQIALGALNGPQPITVHLERLQPNTTYHYRITATNPAHTAYGTDQTFTTTSYTNTPIQETPSTNKPLGINPKTTKTTNKKHGKTTRKKTRKTHKTTHHKKHKK